MSVPFSPSRSHSIDLTSCSVCPGFQFQAHPPSFPVYRPPLHVMQMAPFPSTFLKAKYVRMRTGLFHLLLFAFSPMASIFYDALSITTLNGNNEENRGNLVRNKNIHFVDTQFSYSLSCMIVLTASDSSRQWTHSASNRLSKYGLKRAVLASFSLLNKASDKRYQKLNVTSAT